MKFNLVFDNSGDTLPFTAINPDLLCYVLDQVDKSDQKTFDPENNNHGEQIFNKIKSLQKVSCLIGPCRLHGLIWDNTLHS